MGDGWLEVAEIILRMGAEGGSLSLIHQDGRFALERNESGTHALLNEEDLQGLPPAISRSGWVTWQEALVHLDRYPWLKMVPLFVHPEFKRDLVRALLKRGLKDPEAFFAFAQKDAALE